MEDVEGMILEIDGRKNLLGLFSLLNMIKITKRSNKTRQWTIAYGRLSNAEPQSKHRSIEYVNPAIGRSQRLVSFNGLSSRFSIRIFVLKVFVLEFSYTVSV
jgi:hypothetical protein